MSSRDEFGGAAPLTFPSSSLACPGTVPIEEERSAADDAFVAWDMIKGLLNPLAAVSTAIQAAMDGMLPDWDRIIAELLTCEPQQLTRAASAWGSMARSLDGEVRDFARSVDRLSDDWSGTAFDAFVSHAASRIHQLDTYAAACEGMAKDLGETADLLEKIVDLLAEAIHTLFGLIQDAGWAAIGAGVIGGLLSGGTAAAPSAVVTVGLAQGPAIAKCILKIAELTKKIMGLWGEIREVCNRGEVLAMTDGSFDFVKVPAAA